MLTAFLIESYKNLQEDPQQTTVALLRNISVQLDGLRIASPSLDPAPPPTSSLSVVFQPSDADIAVNVCWFASLLLSLSTASFGILVKSWLREYLAIDRTVPLERLRIRYSRHLGLEMWKLFDIAAALPLILQLSLALFCRLITWC